MNGLTRHIRLEHPVMMGPIFGQLRRGSGDPTHRRVGDISCVPRVRLQVQP